jgi:hypothetical protein
VAIQIQFDKQRVEAWLEALSHGLPVAPPDSTGWTEHDLLALAGVCLFLSHNLGPATFHEQAAAELPTERREAFEKDLEANLQAAIAWYAHATRKVADGSYDERFEPSHEGVVSIDASQKRITVTRGLRDGRAGGEPSPPPEV